MICLLDTVRTISAHIPSSQLPITRIDDRPSSDDLRYAVPETDPVHPPKQSTSWFYWSDTGFLMTSTMRDVVTTLVRELPFHNMDINTHFFSSYLETEVILLSSPFLLSVLLFERLSLVWPEEQYSTMTLSVRWIFHFLISLPSPFLLDLILVAVHSLSVQSLELHSYILVDSSGHALHSVIDSLIIVCRTKQYVIPILMDEIRSRETRLPRVSPSLFLQLCHRLPPHLMISPYLFIILHTISSSSHRVILGNQEKYIIWPYLSSRLMSPFPQPHYWEGLYAEHCISIPYRRARVSTLSFLTTVVHLTVNKHIIPIVSHTPELMLWWSWSSENEVHCELPVFIDVLG